LGRSLGLGAILAALWLLLSGHYTTLILSFGVASIVLVVYLAHRMDVVDHEGVPFLSGRLLMYFPWLMKEIFIANVAVAKIILDPKLPISPIMVRYANSITLTPGTITTGVDDHEFEIHALTYHDVDGREEDAMDKLCAWVEQGAR